MNAATLQKSATATRRVTANLPHQLLIEAQQISGKGITETLILGLEMLHRRRAFETGRSLKGKLLLDIDIETSRERRR